MYKAFLERTNKSFNSDEKSFDEKVINIHIRP